MSPAEKTNVSKIGLLTDFDAVAGLATNEVLVECTVLRTDDVAVLGVESSVGGIWEGMLAVLMSSVNVLV